MGSSVLDKVSKKILYIDMDGVLADFESGIENLPSFMKENFKDCYDRAPGIFSLMKPIPGAIEAFTELSGLFDTYILSTPAWHNPTCASEKFTWVKDHLGEPAHKRLILTHHKNLNKGDYLIDDRFKNGVEGFGGEHIHFGSKDYPDWNTILKYLGENHASNKLC